MHARTDMQIEERRGEERHAPRVSLAAVLVALLELEATLAAAHGRDAPVLLLGAQLLGEKERERERARERERERE
jgi:hypothetical protein